MTSHYQNKIIGLDAGAESTGVVVLVNSKITQALNLPNTELVEFVSCQSVGFNLSLIIEDVRPYNMRITDGIIKTIKLLGWLEGKFTELGQKFELIPRHQVKQWVFLQYKSIAWPEIEKKIIRAGKRKQKECIAAGEPYIKRNSTPTFVYVDDRIVANAMRKHWGIKKPKPGHKTAYGLKDHSWQALALCSFFMATNGIKIS